MEKQGHPRLRRSKASASQSHGLSATEMNTLLPSLHPSEGDGSDASRGFYAASASQPPIPDEVAAAIWERGLPEGRLLARAVLWLLSFRLGTFLLCGRLCFRRRFPFVAKFADLPHPRREKIVAAWCAAKYLFLLRVFFYYVKSMCLFIFVSHFDEESKTNPAWEAMDYKPEETTHAPKGSKQRPLEQGIVETLYESPATLVHSLTQKGLQVTEDRQNNLYKVQCDVVIIGSGCGGAVAAAILAGSGHKVLVLEKGNYYTESDYSLLEKPSMDELLEQGGMLTTVDGGVMLMAATAVGGGSVVNWSASIKTPKEVVREWAEDHQLSLFGSPRYASAMDAVCRRLGVTQHCAKEGLQNHVLRKGCENLGLRVDKVPRNSSEDHYCGSCHFGCKVGDKQGTDVTWLVDAVGKGCVILSGCKAEKLLLAKNENPKGSRIKKCVGVVARSVNQAITMRIQIEAKVTISACGALSTPPLLVSSGLRNKHIGKNLHLHPAMMVWGYFPEGPESGFEGKIYQGGLITSAHEVTDSDKSTIALIETPAIGPSSFAAMCSWESGVGVKERLRKYSRTAHLFCMVRDRGSGEVTKESRVSYRMSGEDKRNMTAGLRRAARILVAAGAVEVGTYRSDGQRVECGGGAVEEFLGSVEALDGPMGGRVWGVYNTGHQMGSCRMGASEREGAVDEDGESWEAEGLFVCDASVAPTAVGVNPMITVQAIAYCIATKLAESIKHKRSVPK